MHEEIPELLLETAIKRRNPRKKIRRYVNNWKPQHTNVVHLHLQGKNDDEIREITGFSSTAIWNILRTPEAMEIKKQVHSRILDRGLLSIPEKLAAIQFQALENVAEFIGNKELKEKNPFAFYDRSVKAAELVTNMTKHGGGVETPSEARVNNTQINAFFLTPEQQKQVSAGIERALTVSKKFEEIPATSVGNLQSLASNG